MEVSTIRVCGDETVKYFSEIFEDKTKYGTKLKTGEYQEQGKYLIVDQGQELIAGYTDREGEAFFDLPAIIFGDHTRILKYVDQPFYIGADGVKILRSKLKDANYKYLFYALKYVSIPNTGYNRHFKWLRQSSIKYPDNVTQNRIVKILDTVSGIIQLRKKELNQLDYLIQARFVEMFGNPFDTSKWTVKKLKDISESMVDGSNVNPDYYEPEGEVLFLRIQNVWRNEFRLDDSVYIAQEINKNQYYDTSLRTGDLLITKIGRYYTKDSSLGRVSVYRGDDDCANYSNNIMRVRLDSSVNSEFVNVLLNLEDYQFFIKRTSKGGTDKRALSKSLIGSYPIILPPKELQDEFVGFVKRIDKSKSAIKKSLEKTQLLFDSLMQKYFG